MIGTILVSLGVLAAPEMSRQPTTRIYVRTIPPGAQIELDGRQLGTSDGLFIVPPGVRKITVEMDGYDPEGKTVEVRDGWITRVEVRLKKRPGPEAGQPVPPNPFETTAGTGVGFGRGAKLDFRIAPTRRPDEPQPIGKAKIERYLDDLKSNGPGPSWKGDGQFAWFELREDINAETITADYDGRRYILLSNMPDEVMLAADSGERAWGVKDVSLSEVAPNSAGVAVEFDEAGSRRLAALSEANLQRHLAILVDDRVIACPMIRSKMSGSAVITGNFDLQEVLQLMRALKVGMTQHDDAADSKTSGQAPPSPFETITRPPAQGDQTPPSPFETQAAGDGLSGFDAVIERTVNEDAEDRDVFIDLDTGELMTPPAALKRDDDKAIQAWIRSHGVDALGKISPEVRGLVGFDMIIVPVVNHHWDSATRRLSAANPLLRNGSPGFPVFLRGEGELPQTYVFKTREGGFGVLQILGFTEDPKGVKIRYKLARPKQTVRAMEDSVLIGHVDDTAEGKRSLAGSGHAVLFYRPEGVKSVVAVQIFASRYGYPQAPEEDFHVYLLDQDQKVIKDLTYPYGLIGRGDERWYTLKTEPVAVPERFYVALSFDPHQTKGVYLGIDENAEEFHSYEGLPRRGIRPVSERCNWMIRVILAREADVGKE